MPEMNSRCFVVSPWEALSTDLKTEIPMFFDWTDKDATAVLHSFIHKAAIDEIPFLILSRLLRPASGPLLDSYYLGR